MKCINGWCKRKALTRRSPSAGSSNAMQVRRKNLCFVSLGVVIPVFDCLFRARICFQYAKKICSCKAKKAAETDVAPNWPRLVSGTLLARFHQF